MSDEKLIAYSVWDRSVRIFHWINVLCVLSLMAIGTVILNAKGLGVSTEGKIFLKTIHIYVGYLFTVNLAWRILWGFVGSHFARWQQVMPFGSKYKEQLKAYIDGSKDKKQVGFLGHNPIARLMVALLFLLLSLQAITGLVLAGTDVYMPPFGNTFKEWVATDSDSVELVKPYSKAGVNPDAYKEMRDFRSPFVTTHYYVFYILLVAIILHLLGVLWSELRERNGIVSAMISGKKVFAKKPFDAD